MTIPHVHTTILDSNTRTCQGSKQSIIYGIDYDYIISADGTGDFTDLSTAFSSITGTADKQTTVLLKAGTYNLISDYLENSTLTHPAYVSLYGEDRDTTIIACENVIYLASNGTAIYNVTMTDNDGDSWGYGWDGITLPGGVHDVTIQNCYIKCAEWCIFGYYAGAGGYAAPYNISIQNNVLDGANPIYLTNGIERSTISNNTVTNTSSAGKACHSFIDASRDFHYNTISNNTVNITRLTGVDTGVYVIRFSGVGNTFENNTISLSANNCDVGSIGDGFILYRGVYEDCGSAIKATLPYAPNTFTHESYTINTATSTGSPLYAFQGYSDGSDIVGYPNFVFDDSTFTYNSALTDTEVVGTVRSVQTTYSYNITVRNNGFGGCSQETNSYDSNVTIVEE